VISKARLLLIITTVRYVFIPECKLMNGLKKPTSAQEKTANLNPDKPPGVPKNKKAGVQVLLRHRTPQTRKPQVSQ
jgi:hypothetical protein